MGPQLFPRCCPPTRSFLGSGAVLPAQVWRSRHVRRGPCGPSGYQLAKYLSQPRRAVDRHDFVEPVETTRLVLGELQDIPGADGELGEGASAWRWGDALTADVEAPAKEQSSDAAVRVAEEGAAHLWLVNGIQDVRCGKSELPRRRVRHGWLDLCEDRVDIS